MTSDWEVTLTPGHAVPSPFPFAVLDVAKPFLVTDERCACGALRSEHADTLAFGHGACVFSGCAKFTWVGWISVDITNVSTLTVLGTLNGWTAIVQDGRVWLVNPLTGHRKSAFPATS